ncbi:PilN domain-containing protein [Massilia sp. LXY-6]|uniref:PilN domain-containing protein n=1 Tax=Massilia sp. LXY-6 TaxID=3379823 RepID=UPI003EDE979D
MKKVRIDFAPPSLARGVLWASRPTWAVVLMLAATGVTLVLACTGLQRQQRGLEQLRTMVRIPTQAPPPGVVAARPPVPEAQAGAVNAAVLQLNLPWRALHDAVQAGTPANIALLALEPDAKKSTVRITAEAKSSDDMIAYVEQLQKVEWFSAVSLARHEINDQDPNRPIRFQLDAQWRETQ